jgi:hypothetical protein
VVVGSHRLIHGGAANLVAAVHLGAALGGALIRAPGRARVTLSVAVIADWLLGFYLDGWLGLIVLAGTVVATSMPRRLGPGDTMARRLSRAAHGAWSYSLGAAIGRVVGRVVGGLLIGPLGAVVGETVGEPVLAALGWLHSQREPRRQCPTPWSSPKV